MLEHKNELIDDNPYRTLADMYESLVKEQAENRKLSMEFSKSSPLNCLSLQEELRPFDFIGLNKQHVEEEETSNKEERKEDEQRVGKTKMFSTTAADFSEAETSSSGFSDETSNKSTQTERNLIPGSFLCSIADGDDCKFSIYDDACPIESRFRKTPEYRTLFREIFAVLKRAAEAKDQGDQLPLLTDDTPLSEVPNVPPVTPAREDVPIDFEDLQSLPESLNMSKATSETSSVIDSHLDETLKENSLEAESSTSKSVPQSSKTGRDIRLTNDILEYISIGVGVKKKAKRKCTNSPARRVKVTDLVEKIEASSQSSPNSPRKSGGRRRKEWRNYDSSQASSRNQSPAIQPHVLTTLERKETPPNSNNKTTSSWLYQPFVSTAAQEVAKLKKLEKSYAEVLKHRPVPKNYARVKGVRLLS
ncbi:hypothetical protein RUM44_008435 [Polyplax serrata]|uniref:Uncharacterized protein n=1 Tax=Polyplax serrata TaxID=468196 RepID=A0ABR1B8B0_POLSC